MFQFHDKFKIGSVILKPIFTLELRNIVRMKYTILFMKEINSLRTITSLPRN